MFGRHLASEVSTWSTFPSQRIQSKANMRGGMQKKGQQERNWRKMVMVVVCFLLVVLLYRWSFLSSSWMLLVLMLLLLKEFSLLSLLSLLLLQFLFWLWLWLWLLALVWCLPFVIVVVVKMVMVLLYILVVFLDGVAGSKMCLKFHPKSARNVHWRTRTNRQTCFSGAIKKRNSLSFFPDVVLFLCFCFCRSDRCRFFFNCCFKIDFWCYSCCFCFFCCLLLLCKPGQPITQKTTTPCFFHSTSIPHNRLDCTTPHYTPRHKIKIHLSTLHPAQYITSHSTTLKYNDPSPSSWHPIPPNYTTQPNCPLQPTTLHSISFFT